MKLMSDLICYRIYGLSKIIKCFTSFIEYKVQELKSSAYPLSYMHPHNASIHAHSIESGAFYMTLSLIIVCHMDEEVIAISLSLQVGLS
jgi:hypothetical protein